DLVGVQRHVKAHLVLVVLERGGLLGDQGSQEDVTRIPHASSPSPRVTSAGRSKTIRSWRRRAATVTSADPTSLSHARFRPARRMASVRSATTSSVGAPTRTPSAASTLTSSFVLAPSPSPSPSTTVSWPWATLSDSALRRAARRAWRGMAFPYRRGVGPK